VTGVPAAAEPEDAELDDELVDALDTYVPIDVSTLGNTLPLSSARLPAITKIVIVPVSDEGGVKVYVYAPGAVCFNVEGTLTQVAFAYKFILPLVDVLLLAPEHSSRST
jgi:hypothetical protein